MSTAFAAQAHAIVHRASDLGEFLQPFVFLDLFDFEPIAGHPAALLARSRCI